MESKLDRSEYLSTPAFWALHYFMIMGTEDVAPEELTEPYFGVAEADVTDLFVRCFQGSEEPWPYLVFSVVSDFAIRLEFRDDGTYLHFAHPSWDEPLLLGWDGGHFALPALRWAEIVDIGRCASSKERDARRGAMALLLLFPFVSITPAEDKAEVKRALINAWKFLGFVATDQIEPLVEQSLFFRSEGLTWRLTDFMGWVNDGMYTLRNGYTNNEVKRLKAFLHAIDACLAEP